MHPGWSRAKKRRFKKRKIKASKVDFGNRERDSKETGSTPKAARGREVSISSTELTQELVYGEAPVGGVLSYIGRQPGTGDLHVVVTLAGHLIDSVRKILVDNREVFFNAFHPNFGACIGIESDPRSGQLLTDRAGLLELYTETTGADNQGPNTALVGATASWGRDQWTNEHRQFGCAYAYVKLHASAEKWDGFPEMSFLVRGKPVFDIRTGQTAWSRNPALIIADFLMDEKFGRLNVPYNSIHWGTSDTDVGSVWWAAEICDQTISAVGGEIPRYSIDTVIDANMDPHNVLSEMAETIGGNIRYFEGKWRIFPGVWTTPVLTLSEEDLRGPIEIQTDISRRDRKNAVKGKFINPYSLYEPEDFPVVKNALYRSQDGIELVEDMTLNMVYHLNQAQRIAKIFLEKSRQTISVRAEFGLTAFPATVGDNILLNFPRYGWTNKPFEVIDVNLIYGEGEGLTVELALHETAEGVYDWNQGEETTVDLAPNTDLPNPFYVDPPTITGLQSGTDQLLRRGDGSVVSRLAVSYTLTDEAEGGYAEIRYRISGTIDWAFTPRISTETTLYRLIDVEDLKTYEIQARVSNVLGVRSEWTPVATHQVVGKTAPPSNVVGFQGKFTNFGSFLQWNSIADLDLKHYEIRRHNDQIVYNGGDETDWLNSVVIDEVSGTQIAIDLLSEGTHRYAIKAVDTSGNYSLSSAWFDFSVLGPKAPSIEVSFVNADYRLSWLEPHKTFAIASYEIRHGATFETSTFLARTPALEFRARADWIGPRKFWVVAYDVADNKGVPGELDVTIIAPGQVGGLRAEVVENNVWLGWNEPIAGTLPIEKYEIRKGEDFNSAASLATVNGTFFPKMEFSQGTYTYHVVAIDTAGNQGVPQNVSAAVTTPPDFRLDVDEVFNSGQVNSSTNLVWVEDHCFIPGTQIKTWEAWFEDAGHETLQEQIDAGNTLFIEPMELSGSVEFIHDMGEVLNSNTTVSLTFQQIPVKGSTTATVTLSVSDDGVTWGTFVAGVTQVAAKEFRYIKVNISFANSNINSVAIFKDVHLRVYAKTTKYTTQVTLPSSYDFFQLNFPADKDFISVEGVQITLQGDGTYSATTPVFTPYEIPPGVSPGSIKMWFLDASGVKRPGTATVTIEGIL